MANESQFLQDGLRLDHTPASALTGGKMIQIGSVPVMTAEAIAASAAGAVAIGGVFRGPHTATIGNVGDNVWWDANGTPVGGSADGAFTADASVGDWWVGTLVKAAAATDATCDFALGRVNRELPAWTGKTHIKTALDLTLTAADHSGGVVHVTADAKTITLPTGVAGMEFIVQNDVADAGAKVSVALDGNEIIAGALLTIAATKLADLTKLTGLRGDYLHLICNVAATSWRCVAKRGIWVTSA